jgi:LuxR family transcriptional regulator
MAHVVEYSAHIPRLYHLQHHTAFDLGTYMLTYLDDILHAQSVDALWALHAEKMHSFGFDRIVYAFTRFSTSHDFGALDDMLVLTNHSDAYVKGIIGDRMFERSPTMRWRKENTNGACLWSWVCDEARAGRLSPSEADVVRFSMSHGVRAGVTIYFPDLGPRASAGISLCAHDSLRQRDVDRLWAERGQEIYVLNSVFHMRINLMPFSTARRQLTDRQKEVLEWVGEGKTAATIATIMGLTTTTVEKHLRLAREALNVETTAQAILKASMQKQIYAIPTSSRSVSDIARQEAAPLPHALNPRDIRESPYDAANSNVPAGRGDASSLASE